MVKSFSNADSFCCVFTECIVDLDKPNLIKLGFGGKVQGLSQLFAAAPVASKNYACFKSGQK